MQAVSRCGFIHKGRSDYHRGFPGHRPMPKRLIPACAMTAAAAGRVELLAGIDGVSSEPDGGTK